MAFNSDEVNLLVYRYLEESGYRHSAFTFGYESNVLNAGIDSTSIPRGALASLLQKGVLFAEAEVFSLLNDGELDARFEKAIGCMTILECAMCDSTKAKALQRRMGATQPKQYNAAEEQQRTPSRIGPQTNLDAQSTSTQATHQNHGFIPNRQESTTMKNSNAGLQQQQRDRDFRAQQSAQAPNNSLNCMPPRGSYRTTLSENVGQKCNPTMPSTSSATTSISASNHMYPGTNTSVMGLPPHPFYHQQQFGKQNASMNHSENNTAYLSANISNGGVNPVNGPIGQSIQQIAPSTGAFSTLSSLQNMNSSQADARHLLLNGTTPYITASGAGSTTKRGTGNG